MFSFFRRQSKKSGDSKKSDGKKTKNSYINNLQCVPVDKYEIDFSRIEETPERAPRTKTPSKCVVMGNAESSRKNDTNSAPLRADSSNAYERRKTETEFSRWSNENEHKDEINKNKHFEIQQNGKTPENKQNERNEINEKPSHVPSGRQSDEQKYEWKTSIDKASSSNESSKCYNCVTNGCSEVKKNDLQCEKTDISAKSESELKKSEKLFTNEDMVNKDINGEWQKTPNFSTSFNSVMTNETEFAKFSCDKYTKQRQQSAEMSQDENREDGFDTAPSSPTSEAIGINQNTKKIITARERFLSLDPQPSENINLNSFTEPERGVVRDEKVTSQAQVANATLDDKTDGSNGNGCELSTENDSKDERFEEAENSERKLRCEKPTVSPNIKEEIQKLPQHVEEFVNLKKSRRQIPDITITESSDSENENESSEEETENYPRCYERSYPTILYDITEVDEPFSDASDMEFNSFTEDDKRNIVQESKFQDQIKTLKCEVETKDTENMQLRGKINDLQREITNKTWGMDRLHAELASFQTEADCVRKKLLKVEEDLMKYKTKNSELNEELLKKLEYESDFKKVSTLQNEIDILKGKIQELQTELENVKQEKKELQAKLNEMELEKNEKIKTLQMALDDTLKQKQKMQARFEEEYEKLRTVNSDREQQLLNDFEWKLREVELTCKKKLEDKDKVNEDKIKQARKQLETEINELKKQIQELEKLKTFEAELTQLRGLTNEQQRSLRMANRATEQLQTNERILNDEIERLRSSLEKERSHLATVQGIHSREIAEKDRKHSFKLEQQKNEINTEWEDKHRRETTRLKLELEKAYKEEKRNLIEECKIKTEKQLKENSQNWEKKLLDEKKQLEELEQKLISKEDSYRKELLRLQTNSDRDMLELRRKLDKMDLAYQEQLEKQQEKHEQEIEAMRENCEKRIQQSEQNWSQQISSTRATLELVKEQLQRESEDQLEALSKKYMLQLEQQYERLIEEKEKAIAEMQEKYSTEMHELQNQLNEELKVQKNKENELLGKINQLEEEIDQRNQNESEIQQNVDSLHNTISELQKKISTYDNLSKEAEALLRKKEAEHSEAISELKEHYENEIRQWQSKFTSSNKELRSSDNATKSEECNASNIDRHSRSSRRKGRGRHKGQKNQHQQQYNHQFSSSSL